MTDRLRDLPEHRRRRFRKIFIRQDRRLLREPLKGLYCRVLRRKRQKIRRCQIDIRFLLFFLQPSHFHPPDGPGSPFLAVVAQVFPGVPVCLVSSLLHQADEGTLGNGYQQQDKDDCEDKKCADGPEGSSEETAKRAAQHAAPGPGFKKLRGAFRLLRPRSAEQMDQGPRGDQKEKGRRDLYQRPWIILVRDPVDPGRCDEHGEDVSRDPEKSCLQPLQKSADRAAETEIAEEKKNSQRKKEDHCGFRTEDHVTAAG